MVELGSCFLLSALFFCLSVKTTNPRPAFNYFEVESEATILAKIITKYLFGTFSFVMIFVVITKLIPPADFLCNIAASGVSLFARKQAKEFVL